MSVTEFIHQDTVERRFSFEVLPPLKGTGTEKLFADIDKLREFNPAYINITTHHSEFVYKELANGQFERQRIRRRPGTVAIAAAIQQRYNIPVQPHVICSGATIDDIEYELSTCSSSASATCSFFVATKPRKTVASCPLLADTPTRRTLSNR